jgi:AAA family ATP:ADP antiporter
MMIEAKRTTRSAARRVGHTFERLLGAEVRAGEGRLVFAFFINLLLLLTAYYVLKVVREPLILMHGGAVSRSYARGVQAMLLIAIVPVYGVLANRVEPGRLVNWINAFFIVSLGVFVALGAFDFSIGFAFFVWLGIFSTMAIAQFWSLANDLFTELEGKRLFPLVAAGGTLGGIVGSQIAARGLVLLGPYELMVVASALLVLCMALTHFSRVEAAAYRRSHPHVQIEQARDASGGFTLLLRDRYLLMIGASVLLLNLINTTGDYVLAEMVNDAAMSLYGGGADAEQARSRFIGAFYGDFQTVITLLTALVQFFVVARVFKVAGVERALLFLPLFVVVGYGASALAPLLMVVVLVKVTENSADYSLQNTLQQALFLPTSRDAKYKAKTAIDTFIVRVGDLASASLVLVGIEAELGARGFAWVNVGLGLVWIAVALQLIERRRAMSAPPTGALQPVAAATLAPTEPEAERPQFMRV